MDELAGSIAIAMIAWWFYKSGKRDGSRKGYNIGRLRSKERQRHH